MAAIDERADRLRNMIFNFTRQAWSNEFQALAVSPCCRGDNQNKSRAWMLQLVPGLCGIPLIEHAVSS